MSIKRLVYCTLASCTVGALIANSAMERNQAPRLKSLREIRDTTRLSSAAPSLPLRRGISWSGPGKVESNAQGFSITLDDQKWFEPGSAQMTTQGISEVNQVAFSIKGAISSWKAVQVQVEGHTTSTPVVRHKNLYASNWELSGSRAFTVVRLLEVNGFSRELLSGIGYADTRADHPGGQRKIVIKVQYPEAQEIAQK